MIIRSWARISNSYVGPRRTFPSARAASAVDLIKFPHRSGRQALVRLFFHGQFDQRARAAEREYDLVLLGDPLR